MYNLFKIKPFLKELVKENPSDFAKWIKMNPKNIVSAKVFTKKVDFHDLFFTDV